MTIDGRLGSDWRWKTSWISYFIENGPEVGDFEGLVRVVPLQEGRLLALAAAPDHVLLEGDPKAPELVAADDVGRVRLLLVRLGLVEADGRLAARTSQSVVIRLPLRTIRPAN